MRRKEIQKEKPEKEKTPKRPKISEFLLGSAKYIPKRIRKNMPKKEKEKNPKNNTKVPEKEFGSPWPVILGAS